MIQQFWDPRSHGVWCWLASLPSALDLLVCFKLLYCCMAQVWSSFSRWLDQLTFLHLQFRVHDWHEDCGLSGSFGCKTIKSPPFHCCAWQWAWGFSFLFVFSFSVIVLSWNLRFNMLSEVCTVLEFASLSIMQSKFGLSTHHFLLQNSVSHCRTLNISPFIEVCTDADDKFSLSMADDQQHLAVTYP